MTLTMTILILAVCGAVLLGFGVAVLVRVLMVRKKDNKPLLLSVVLQHDDCSRVTGEYVDNYLEHATGQVIIWRNGQEEGGGVLKSESLSDEDAVKLLLTAAKEIGQSNGIKTAVIL